MMLFLQNITGFMVGREIRSGRHRQTRRQDGHSGRPCRNSRSSSAAPSARRQLPGRPTAPIRHDSSGCGRQAASPSWAVCRPHRCSPPSAANRQSPPVPPGRTRDATFRVPIIGQYERRGKPVLPTARLWDDGIIDPMTPALVVASRPSKCAHTPLGGRLLASSGCDRDDLRSRLATRDVRHRARRHRGEIASPHHPHLVPRHPLGCRPQRRGCRFGTSAWMSRCGSGTAECCLRDKPSRTSPASSRSARHRCRSGTPGYGFPPSRERRGFAEYLWLRQTQAHAARVPSKGLPGDGRQASARRSRSTIEGGSSGSPVSIPEPEAITVNFCRCRLAIGFPLPGSRPAGGGGKGMHLVESAHRLDEAIACRHTGKALSSFGDDTIFIERFVSHARATSRSRCLPTTTAPRYLGERECSLQRRHQVMQTPGGAPSARWMRPRARDR
jgi:hypothetical protein